MEPEYVNLLRQFHAEDVEYVVVGGYAVAAHGHPRTTSDLDVLVNPTPDNARRVVRALERLGFIYGEFEEADFAVAPSFVNFVLNGRYVDLLTEIRGVSFADCRAHALSVTFGDVTVRYIGLGALRLAKAAAGRPQDLLDLENLPPAPDQP